MRVLGLETSSSRGSVALVELREGVAHVVGYAFHDEANEHAERLLSLVDGTLVEAGWHKSSIQRLAVGVGPGSFTGVRVALSLAQGLMLGLGIPGVGVGSLRAVAAGHDASDPRLRVVVRDARREEFFVAAYSATGEELVAPHTIAQKGATELLAERFSKDDYVVLGTRLDGLRCEPGEESTCPDARPIARIGSLLALEAAPVEPQYVRGPNILRPQLPDSPLSQPRS